MSGVILGEFKHIAKVNFDILARKSFLLDKFECRCLAVKCRWFTVDPRAKIDILRKDYRIFLIKVCRRVGGYFTTICIAIYVYTKGICTHHSRALVSEKQQQHNVSNFCLTNNST